MDQAQLNRLSELTNHLTNDTSGSNAAARFLIWGASGVGKSHLCMQILDEIVAPDKAIVWIDTADNFLIGPQVGIKHPWQRLPFTFIEDIRIMAAAIREGVEPWNMVGGLLLDEASAMAQADVNRLHEHRIKNWNPAHHQGKEAPLSPDWDDSRPALNRWRNMLTDLWSVPGLHIMLTAHEMIPGGESKETKARADFPPATYKETKGKVSFVGRLESDTVGPGKIASDLVRNIQVWPTGGVDAKNRLGIQDIRFDSRFLPQGAKGWLESGAPEATEVEEVTAPVVTETATDSETFEAIEDFVIAPIN
jgi:GTPase SAR1 family protein